MLYSLNGAYPVKKLPERIFLSSGISRTDPTSFTEEEILDAGWVQVADTPLFNANTHKAVWNSSLRDWEVIALPTPELEAIQAAKWTLVRQERDTLLKLSDTLLIRELESNGIISQELKDYRQALRDVPINNPDPDRVTWPINSLEIVPQE